MYRSAFRSLRCSTVKYARWSAAGNYVNRHVGPTAADTEVMLQMIGKKTISDLMADAIPSELMRPPMKEIEPLSEKDALSSVLSLGARNRVLKSMIGQGYYECITPSVLLRNVIENPGWYTPYTPYQAEISQGRLESLLNFQTMITDLTKMDVANASLLDQATACAEAMYLAFRHHNRKRDTFFVSKDVFPSCIEMIKTRAEPLKIKVVVDDPALFDWGEVSPCGMLVQNPDANGTVHDFTELFQKAKDHGVLCCCGADLMASLLIKPPGEMGADVVVGTSQRFGIPLGYGGPHAAFFAAKEQFKRLVPGRIVGVSKDVAGDPAIRMALQTREQHIKRERATSNICTAQALLATVSAFYAVYHGPGGLTDIANEIHQKAKTLAVGMESAGHSVVNTTFFDTLTFNLKGITPEDYASQCNEKGINVFLDYGTGTVSISVDEATTETHIMSLLEAAGLKLPVFAALTKIGRNKTAFPEALARTSSFLQHSVFCKYRSEGELMRYIHRLQRKDYGLTHGCIPLGSCTMKLNPASAMLPLSWGTFTNLHPLAPSDQVQGYSAMCFDLEQKIRDVTGLDAVSLQPNSGAQGEYAGLRVVRAYHQSKGEGQRNVCLIPVSAHGTNPASAVLAGMKVVTLKCLEDGRIDVEDLKQLCEKHSKELSCIMLTYPSTYGLFDRDILSVTSLVHQHGGQCYIDGANLNAMVGYTGPGFIGGDLCHINLHKTFSIPHGGGGPGMGPIAVRQHLAPFLPNSVLRQKVGGSQSFGQVSQAAYGSASILTVSYMLMLMLGTRGMKVCTEHAILNANYLKKRLEKHYRIMFLGEEDLCAHEFIIDLRPFKKSAEVEAEDVSKRLMDYGIHSPTVAFPIPGTLMIEPTESESKQELDRLADALISIRGEIAAIERGEQDKTNNVLKNAPHTAKCVTAENWDRPYSRRTAAFPAPHSNIEKYWPTVGRIDGAYGDRHLMCNCMSLDSFK
ncbi:glycine dehydrogenase, putative [Trypanosoma brucei gambiense DAL972]|uniref:Glycine cleavage system P protein n=1 Tax=Trypanosoma brucei gambiense (strain MHOM/CI/86/DAL972) TaxID=679716 RepID=C9ZS84_TRYB9|nr:glycine dehydrogenase, putative [Trypanosoma brucei gambiense DAL972]CBH12220.1 glycine dehydrogenase, putative [Trypanosoma brucei gambiense DAL972]|eukprot:XP_011774503.1 glycine dehydrogenase, putative [Trypanosoma brucei gambiense DAL972]